MAHRARCFFYSIYVKSRWKQRHACRVFSSTTTSSQTGLHVHVRVHTKYAAGSPPTTYRSYGPTCTSPCILSRNAQHYIGRNQHYPAKVMPQFARPMSQSSDADVERMEEAYEKSYRDKHAGDGSRLIYEIRGLGMMRFCSTIIYGTTLMALYMSPDLLTTAVEHDTINSEMILSLATIALAVGVMPTFLIMFNRRLILKLYHDKGRGTYQALTLSPMLTLQKMDFMQDEVVPVKNIGTILGMIKMNTIKVKGRPLYVNPYNFSVPSDFNRLMGYE